MATFTFSPTVGFHPGATIHCYLAASSGGIISPTPVESAVVASDGTVTFEDLADGTRYAAGLTTAGPFVSFRTATPVESPLPNNNRVLIWDLEAEEYLPAEFRVDTSQAREFIGPTDPATIADIIGPVYGDRWTPTEEPTA